MTTWLCLVAKVGIWLQLDTGSLNYGLSGLYLRLKNLNFTESCVEPNSEKRKGCGIYCKVKEPYITCPSCNTFTWHKSCIQRICTEFSLDIPVFTTKTWKCPNCQEFNHFDMWFESLLGHLWFTCFSQQVRIFFLGGEFPGGLLHRCKIHIWTVVDNIWRHFMCVRHIWWYILDFSDIEKHFPSFL